MSLQMTIKIQTLGLHIPPYVILTQVPIQQTFRETQVFLGHLPSNKNDGSLTNI